MATALQGITVHKDRQYQHHLVLHALQVTIAHLVVEHLFHAHWALTQLQHTINRWTTACCAPLDNIVVTTVSLHPVAYVVQAIIVPLGKHHLLLVNLPALLVITVHRDHQIHCSVALVVIKTTLANQIVLSAQKVISVTAQYLLSFLVQTQLALQDIIVHWVHQQVLVIRALRAHTVMLLDL